MNIPFYLIDAFADRPFSGNPAAVCLLESLSGVDAGWMQDVAIEMGFSETAFLDLENRELRWFTPGGEVDLCGHATVGTAQALIEEGQLAAGEQIVFQSRSGPLTVDVLADDRIQLDFPATPPEELPGQYDDLKSILATTPVYVGKSRFDLMVELPSESDVRNLQPDFAQLAKLPYRGVMVTASSEPPYDFVSRFFAPTMGINEDPVTGSAHCCLTPYWADKKNQTVFRACQVSSRGGVIDLELENDRVKLAGNAVTVVKGKLTIDANT